MSKQLTYQLSLHGIVTKDNLESLLERLMGITGSLEYKDLFEHEIVFRPSVETPIGPERNKDLMLRLVAPVFQDKEFVKLKKLFYYGPPEMPTTVNLRPIYEMDIAGDIFMFLDMLCYRFNFEYVRKGFTFDYDSVRIDVFRVCELPIVNKVSSLKEPEGDYMIQLSVKSLQKDSKENSSRLLQVASFLKGLVDLKPVDQVVFQNKIAYRS